MNYNLKFIINNYDFLEESDKQTIDNLSDNILIYSHYFMSKKEMKDLFPKIYIIDNIDLVLKLLPMSQHCYIGTGDKTKETIFYLKLIIVYFIALFIVSKLFSLPLQTSQRAKYFYETL